MEKSQFIRPGTNLRKMEILNLLEKQPYVTQEVLADKVGLTPGMVNKYLKEFLQAEYVCKDGEQKKSAYRLTSQGQGYLKQLKHDYYLDIEKLYTQLSKERKAYQTKKQIKVAAINSLGTMIPVLTQSLGVLMDNYTLDICHYPNGEKIMEEFEDRGFSFAFLGAVPALLAQILGTPIEILGSINNGGHAILTREGTGIETLENLEGKTVVVVGPNSVSANLFKSLLKKNKYLHRSTLVRVIDELEPDALKEGLLRGDYDALLIWEPYVSYISSDTKQIKILYDFNSSDLSKYVSNVMVVNKDFKKEFPGVFADLLDSFIKTIEILESDKGEIDRIIASELQMEEKVVKMARTNVSFKFNKMEWRIIG